MVDYFKQYSLENGRIDQKDNIKLSKNELMDKVLMNEDYEIIQNVISVPKNDVDKPEVIYIDESDQSVSSEEFQ
jgi:hypothetical protein